MDGDWQAEQIAFQDVMKPHAHSDWSLMLPRGLVEAQREERAQGLQNTYCSLVFAGQDTKYARGWLGSSSSPQASAQRGRDKLGAIHHPYPKKIKRKGGKKAFSSPQRRSQVQFSRLGKENLRRVTFSLSDARWALLCLRLSANPSNSFCHHGSSALLKRTVQSLITENNELDYTNCWSWK